VREGDKGRKETGKIGREKKWRVEGRGAEGGGRQVGVLDGSGHVVLYNSNYIGLHGQGMAFSCNC